LILRSTTRTYVLKRMEWRRSQTHLDLDQG
jgi:hypothetical protein